jgi:hypothetical protein
MLGLFGCWFIVYRLFVIWFADWWLERVFFYLWSIFRHSIWNVGIFRFRLWSMSVSSVGWFWWVCGYFGWVLECGSSALPDFHLSLYPIFWKCSWLDISPLSYSALEFPPMYNSQRHNSKLSMFDIPHYSWYRFLMWFFGWGGDWSGTSQVLHLLVRLLPISCFVGCETVCSIFVAHRHYCAFIWGCWLWWIWGIWMRLSLCFTFLGWDWLSLFLFFGSTRAITHSHWGSPRCWASRPQVCSPSRRSYRHRVWAVISVHGAMFRISCTNQLSCCKRLLGDCFVIAIDYFYFRSISWFFICPSPWRYTTPSPALSPISYTPLAWTR